tara:strand:+ start:912 stop:1091 length:180 start_codon:yes stop_codon:yes gene_type:complete
MFSIALDRQKYAIIIIEEPIKLGIIFVNPSLAFKKKPLAITPDVIAINKNKYDTRNFIN